MASVPVVVWVLAAGAVIIGGLITIWLDARIAARAIVPFFATIMLPVLVVMCGLLAIALPRASSIDPRVGQAFRFGQYALRSIKAYSDRGPAAAGKLCTRAAAQSLALV